MARHLRHRAWAVLAGAIYLLPPALADAQPSSAEQATAEALFQQGTALMAEKNYEQACEKFEGSRELDAALGTMLRLADCYDHAGKTASAWALFQEVASLARTRNEPERQQIASDRASDLERRLSKLELQVPHSSAASDLTIRLNGTPLPRATWGTPFPVDPGPQQLVVAAPGRVSFSTTVDVPRGAGLKAVPIPELKQAASKPAPVEGPARGVAAEAAPSSSHAVAYVVGSAGLVGLGLGGYFAYHARSLNQDSRAHCRPNDDSACSRLGVSERTDARAAANRATIALIAGGALLSSGVILLWLSPHAEHTATNTNQLSAAAVVVPGAASVGLEGTW